MKKTERQSEWSIPLTLGSKPLDQTAAGRHDQQWTQLGRQLAALPERPVVTLKTPTDTDLAQAKTAYRRVADLVHDRAPRAILTWAAPTGATVEQVQAAYPGDDLVHAIAVDVPTTGKRAEAQDRLTGVSDWAAQHGKRLVVHWAVDKNVTPAQVRDVRDWVELTATQKRIALVSIAVASDTPPATERALKKEWGR